MEGKLAWGKVITPVQIICKRGKKILEFFYADWSDDVDVFSITAARTAVLTANHKFILNVNVIVNGFNVIYK